MYIQYHWTYQAVFAIFAHNSIYLAVAFPEPMVVPGTSRKGIPDPTALGNAMNIDQSIRPPLRVVSHTRPALSESCVFHWFYKVFLMYDSKHRKASFAQRDHMILKEHVRNCCGSGKDSENGMTQPYP